MDAFIQRFSKLPLKAPNIHPFRHTFTPTVESATQGESQLVRSSQAGDRTSNLRVTSRPALPPEQHAAQVCSSIERRSVVSACSHWAALWVNERPGWDTARLTTL